MTKKIMIVGAGFGQLPAIEKAKKLGYQVIAIDKNSKAIGMSKADISVNIDIIDIEAVINTANEYGIDGIMTMQSDIAVPAVGAVVDTLKLEGVGLIVANRCSNKIETRKLFEKSNVPQPNFKVITTYEEAISATQEIGLPCVIKSPDSSASRGVTKVAHIKDVKNAFSEGKKYSRINELLVEEFIEGEEIGAQAFSINGKCVKVLVHNDSLSEPPYMIPTGHSFPSVLSSDALEYAIESCKKAIDALGIHSGPSNIDLILSKEGVPMIIEVGARIGATCLPELVKYHTGIDWVEQTICNCLGQKVNLETKQNKPVAALILESDKDGIFTTVIPPQDINSKDVLEWEITAHFGDNVQKFRKGTDRIGKIITTAETVQKAEKRAKQIKERFQYNVDTE